MTHARKQKRFGNQFNRGLAGIAGQLGRALGLAIVGATFSPIAASAADLVASDRIGRVDAPKSFTFRVAAILSNNHPVPQFSQAMAALYEKFAQSHPDWRVDIELQSTNIPQEQASLLARARAGNAPDCAIVDTQFTQLFIKNGVLKPISQHFSKEEIDDLFPFIRPVVSDAKGELFGWWWTTDLRIIYRNTELVPKAPATWDEMKAAALEAQKKAGAGVDGFLFNGGRDEVTMIDFLGHYRAAGGKLVNDDGKPIFGDEPNRTALLKAINYYKGLVDSGASPRRVASLKSYDDMTAAAVAGSAAMIQSVDSRYPQLKAGMKPEQFAKWQASELPGETADRRSTATGGGAFASFSNNPEKVKACMDLIRSVYMGAANEVLGRIPTRRSLFDTLPTFKTPFFAQMRDYLLHGEPRPGVPIYPELSNQLQVAIGEVLSGSSTPEKAIDRAVENVNKAYATQQAR